MNPDTFRALLTPTGQGALQAAAALQPREQDFLTHFSALSRTYPPELARAALETAILRLQADAKFPFADQLYFTREALEQATAWPVATYRAARFTPFSLVADLGCGAGGDSMALAGVTNTLGIDLDPVRLSMARANLAALGLQGKAAFMQADLAAALPFALPGRRASALFFDPARRAGHRRAFSVRSYQPPLAVIRDWLALCPAIGVKISPGVNLEELAGYDAEVEFISLNGELKEAALWFGPLKSAARRATVLPGAHSLASESPASPIRVPVGAPQAYIYEPDAAILRAGLVQELGAMLGAAQLDPDIAYLTANKRQPTPFARVWAVEDWLPFNLKRLRAYLRQRGVGRVTVKKRGSPLQPEALIRDLRLSGEGECVLFLTHLNGDPVVIVAESLGAD